MKVERVVSPSWLTQGCPCQLTSGLGSIDRTAQRLKCRVRLKTGVSRSVEEIEHDQSSAAKLNDLVCQVSVQETALAWGSECVPVTC